MCDTLGVIFNNRAVFAKNSDRSPNEPQVLEFYPARDPQEPMLQTTYLAIDQVAHTYACLLSRPTWLWGAEMGVNEHGVCIGNEAVFTKGKYSKTGLTGMDLLRLGLERGASAEEARDLIIALLERHGQGGNCGFDHEFFYDNSFLIMDRHSLFVLETAGRDWAYKAYPRASISNRLTLGRDADAYSGGKQINFRQKHSDLLFTHFSGSKARHGQTCANLERVNGLPSFFAAMRHHASELQNPLCQGSVGSTCMHAGGFVGDHSSASMVVDLDESIKVWVTGSSTPCLSLFKPWNFGEALVQPLLQLGRQDADAYWQERERFHRLLIGRVMPPAFYAERDALEASWIARAEAEEDWQVLSQSAIAEEEAFYARWADALPEPTCGTNRFLRYWMKKNETLGQPRQT